MIAWIEVSIHVSDELSTRMEGRGVTSRAPVSKELCHRFPCPNEPGYWLESVATQKHTKDFKDEKNKNREDSSSRWPAICNGLRTHRGQKLSLRRLNHPALDVQQ